MVCSSASILSFDERVVELCLLGDEQGALSAAHCPTEAEVAERSGPIYAASKRALTRWIRRTASRADWAGAGILVNGVSPGLVATPMTAPLLATDEGRAILSRVVPRAVPDAAVADDIAQLLVFLASPANRYMVGQVPFCDGGTDVLMRGDEIL